MPTIQMPTAISEGSWTRLTSTGEATAAEPSTTAAASDGVQRATTNASIDTSKKSGSSSPERCAATTGTVTATEITSNGTFGLTAQTANATTGTAARARLAAEDGSTIA